MDKPTVLSVKMLSTLSLLLVGCAQSPEVGESEYDATAAALQYTMTAPYQDSGTVMAGSDGIVYSVLPAAPLASDPWQLLFCYSSSCFTLKQPLDFVPSGEVDIPLPYNATITASGNVSCNSWTSASRISWYDATPLHWHVSLNVTCSDGSVSFRGDWRRVN